jgi:hypothetical protein
MAERYRTQAYFDRLSLPADETDKTFYDDKVPALGLRFRAEGKPKWTLYFQRQGRQRRYVIGPRSLKLEAARDAAQLLQGSIAKGVDIAQVRKDERKKTEQDTFGQAVEKYLEAREKGIWPPNRPAPRATTFAEIKRYLNSDEGYFRPLHRIAVANISRDDVKKRASARPIPSPTSRNRASVNRGAGRLASRRSPESGAPLGSSASTAKSSGYSS